MVVLIIKNYKAYFYIFFIIFFVSCGITYRDKMADVYKPMEKHQYTLALQQLNTNKFIRTKRNQLLYLLEKGQLNRFLEKYDSSNYCWNQADDIASQYGSTVGSTIKGFTLNPMLQDYHGEPFEKFLLHYYKALNYLDKNLYEDAFVEARRITLTDNQTKDKTKGKENKYYTDPFALFFQGLLYENSNMVNDAFISYRNGIEAITKRPNNTWYGVPLNTYYLQAFFKSASRMGFYDDIEWWKKKLNLTPQQYAIISDITFPKNELFLFVENGFVPVKEEEKIFLNLVGANGFNQLTFVTDNGALSIPFFIPSGYQQRDFLTFQSIYIALPKYVVRPLRYTKISLQDSLNRYITLDKSMDLNVLALETLRERRVADITQTLTRVLVKKITQIAVTKAVEHSTDNKSNVPIASLVNIGLDLAAVVSEKADTRNWQSLPAEIYFARIPLHAGDNMFTLQFTNPITQASKTITLHVQPNGGKVFKQVRVW